MLLVSSSTLNISEKTRDTAILSIERQQEVILCGLSNGAIFNDLYEPLTRFSRTRHIWSRISEKTVRFRDTVTIEH